MQIALKIYYKKNQNSIILHILACTVMPEDKISIPPAEAIKLKLLKSIVIDQQLDADFVMSYGSHYKPKQPLVRMHNRQKKKKKERHL